jgi:hypothetical protein
VKFEPRLRVKDRRYCERGTKRQNNPGVLDIEARKAAVDSVAEAQERLCEIDSVESG